MSNVRCGCCEGTKGLTPRSTANRPGLGALRYRVGTHADFLSTMLARLSSPEFPALGRFTTRDPRDFSIALLDAWAVAADVLTFYSERIANEGYLRTGTERRSILELARLVDYEVRPGVAASVYLAYGLEQGHEVVVPAGSPAQSVPGPGERAQTFETSEPVLARDTWSQMKLRTSRPQSIRALAGGSSALWLAGTDTGLTVGSVLVVQGATNQPQLRDVTAVEPDEEAKRTKVTIDSLPAAAVDLVEKISVEKLLASLATPPSRPPFSAARLARNLNQSLAPNADGTLKLLTGLRPVLASTLHKALGNADATDAPGVRVFAFRVQASLYGHNAGLEPAYEPPVIGGGEFPQENPKKGQPLPPSQWTEWPLAADEQPNAVFLERDYPGLLAGTAVAVRSPEHPEGQLFTATRVKTISRNAYAVPAKTTRVELDGNWRDPAADPGPDLGHLRQTTVYAEPEELELAEEPITDPLCGDLLELEDLHDGLTPGRLLVVSGERSDIAGTSGVPAAELVMVAEVSQDVAQVSGPGKNGSAEKVPLAGDRLHTLLRLATPLAYCYELDTVRVYGNVVHATHGETRHQVLGSGDGAKSLQRFTLQQSPLTHVSAVTPSGVESTLVVRVDDLRWHQARSLADLGPQDRRFITVTDDAGDTTVVFGTGERGARLPSGGENVRAVFRGGIGAPGNVRAGQISVLTSKPLGVKEVVNPLAATGGADPESRDQARENAPLAVKALDRLVSVQDYADFARMFAGVGKASASRLTDGRRQFVLVTVAGAAGSPIGADSDLLHNLELALRRFGDPSLPVQVAVRELLALVVVASVGLHPDHQWESVEPRLRATLLEAFGFDRALAQDVTSSEVLRVMHRVPGVASVDLDILDAVPDGATVQDLRHLTDPANPDKLRLRHRVHAAPARSRPTRPAQLAVLLPDAAETLLLRLQTVPSS
jgi:predicted phage baseplate assembly protein